MVPVMPVLSLSPDSATSWTFDFLGLGMPMAFLFGPKPCERIAKDLSEFAANRAS